MHLLATFWHSTIGKKIVMAVTGLIGIGFLISHVVSNLQMFGTPEHLDSYAQMLRSLGPLLWVARAVLLGAVILHVVAAVQLTARKSAARPVDYHTKVPQAATLASRTMFWGGVVLALFIVWHILDMTLGVVTPGFEHLRPSHNLPLSLRRVPVAAFSLVAMVSLGFHLYHGTWSFLKTLGVSRESAHPLKHGISAILAIAIAAGFAALPIGVLLGIIR